MVHFLFVFPKKGSKIGQVPNLETVYGGTEVRHFNSRKFHFVWENAHIADVNEILCAHTKWWTCTLSTFATFNFQVFAPSSSTATNLLCVPSRTLWPLVFAQLLFLRSPPPFLPNSRRSNHTVCNARVQTQSNRCGGMFGNRWNLGNFESKNVLATVFGLYTLVPNSILYTHMIRISDQMIDNF